MSSLPSIVLILAVGLVLALLVAAALAVADIVWRRGAPGDAFGLRRLLLHGPLGEHLYLSTGCLHGDHAYCQNRRGQAGPKRPGECKQCGAPCICPCHREERRTEQSPAPLPQPALDVRAAAATCPGYETRPNQCRCPCNGCRQYCFAHNPKTIPGWTP